MGRLLSTMVKIERAKEHVRNLQSEISTFWGSNKYTITPEDDPETGDEVFRFHGNLELPLNWSVIIGEALHDLRSALDHLAWQLVDAHSPGKGSKSTEFPIFDSSEKYETRVKAKIKGASDKAIDIAKSLKAYKGGNDIFFVHALNIIDKHRMLVTTGMARFAIIATGQYDRTDAEGRKHFVFRSGGSISTAPVFLEEGAEVYRIQAASKNAPGVDMNPQFSFDIAFNEPTVIQGGPVVGTLYHLAEVTRETIGAFYTGCPEIQ
jgi:hypothetical protein